MSIKKDIKTRVFSVIFSTSHQKILAYFLQHTARELYDRQIANETRLSRAGTNVALRELATIGLLHRTPRGRMSFYSIDAEDPLVRQLKVVQNLTYLRPLVHSLKDHTSRMILFGSAARGENQEESDCDLLLLTRNPIALRERLATPFTAMRLHAVVHSPREWIMMQKTDPTFFAQVTNGITLWESHEP